MSQPILKSHHLPNYSILQNALNSEDYPTFINIFTNLLRMYSYRTDILPHFQDLFIQLSYKEHNEGWKNSVIELIRRLSIQFPDPQAHIYSTLMY